MFGGIRRAAVVIVATAVVATLLPAEQASAADPQPSICSGGRLAGRETDNNLVSGSYGGSLWVGAGASVRVAGTVRNISSTFGADMSWRLDPFASGVTPAGQTSAVNTTWTNGSSDRLVSFSFVMNSIFTRDFSWDFTFVVSGSQPFACRSHSQQLGTDQTQGEAADPVNTATGNFHDTTVDLSVPSVYGMAFERTYNSLAGVGPAQPGGTMSSWLGPGWTTTLDERLMAVTGGLAHRSPDGQRQFFPEASPTTWQVPPELFATAVSVPDGGRELRFAWGEVRSFLPDGRVRWFDDGAGQRVTVTRATGSVVLTSVVGGAPGFEIKAFDDVVAGGGAGQDNLLDRVEIAGGPSVSYTYAGGRLARVALAPPAGEVASGESFTYVNGQLDTIVTDVGGGRPGVVRVDNAYDASGRVQSQVQAGGDVVAFAYAELDTATQTRTTTVTHGSGADAEVVTYVHDPDGRLVQVLDPFNRATGRSWERDRPDTVTSRRGAATDFDYDAAGRLDNEDLADPATPGASAGVRQASYCSATPGDARLRTTTDAAGVVTEYRYGATTDAGYPCAAGQMVPTEVVEAAGTTAAASTRVESSAGLVSTVTDADGVRTELAWDTARRLLLASTVDADAGVAGKETTYFAYDGAGRRRAQRTPLGIETWWSYDPAGRLTATVGPVAGPARTCGATTCDFGDTAPAGPTVRLEYWADGTLRARVDEAGKRWEHRVDTVATGGWEVRETEPDGDVAISTYDAAGRLVSVTTGDPDLPAELATVTYDHDRLGRVRRRVSAEGVQTHFGYDADGNQTTVVAGPDPTDPARTTTRSFDLRGRMTAELGPTGDVDRLGAPSRSQRTWRYDDADRLVETTEGSGATLLRTWVRYDEAGRRRFVIVDRDGDAAPSDPASPDPAQRDAADQVTELRYTPAGRLASRAGPPPDVTSFDWVGGDQAAKVVEAYRYDGAGRLSGRTDADGETVSTYDADGRLKRVTLPGGAYQRFVRDPAGRVVSAAAPSPTGAGEMVESWGYDARGLLTSHTGRRATGPTDTVASLFFYTDDARLERAVNPLRKTLGVYAEVRYGYDGRGNRTSRTAWANPDPAAPSAYTQVTEGWEHDLDDALVAHVRPSGATTTYAYNGLGQLVSVAQPSGRSQTRSYRNSGALANITSRQPGQPDVPATRRYDDRGRLGSVSTGDTYLQYSWDRPGNLIQAAQSLDGSLQVTKFRYDLSDRHTRTIHHGGAAVDERHDRLGRTVGIDLTEAGGSPTTLAAYTYDANGMLRTEALGPAGTALLS